MSKTNFEKEKIPFTQVANSILNDKNLSWEAKGLFGYLYSKPENWNFSSERISSDSKNGIDKTKTTLKELEDNGYLIRKRKGDGRMIYRLYFKKPKVDFATKGKSHCGKIHQISNKEKKVIKNNIYKNIYNNSIVEILDAFKEVNISYENFFKNKTQRSAIERLLKKVGKEDLLKIVKLLKETNKEEYAPTITTPYELEQKFSKLGYFIKKNKSSKVIRI